MQHSFSPDEMFKNQLSEFIDELHKKGLLPNLTPDEKKDLVKQVANELKNHFKDPKNMFKQTKGFKELLQFVVQAERMINQLIKNDPKSALKYSPLQGKIIQLLLTPKNKLAPEQQKSIVNLKLLFSELLLKMRKNPLSKEEGDTLRLLEQLFNQHAAELNKSNKELDQNPLLENKALLGMIDIILLLTDAQRFNIAVYGQDPSSGMQQKTIDAIVPNVSGIMFETIADLPSLEKARLPKAFSTDIPKFTPPGSDTK